MRTVVAGGVDVCFTNPGACRDETRRNPANR
ncbi:hypothetical protein GGD67_002938 [Bradyrhizobium sp. IAR9]|nr:hypothetical protein [Bradyrhizobium sp. IAR9]